jgi:hypothetical protein
LAAATISKMPVKPLPPPRLTPLVPPFRTTKTLTEYDAVALELVREHPLLTEIGSYQRPRQPNLPIPGDVAHDSGMMSPAIPR